MNVYVAAPSGLCTAAQEIAEYLRANHFVESTWHDNTQGVSYHTTRETQLRDESQRDIEQIRRADVLFVVDPSAYPTTARPESRGGVHSELGMALYAGKLVILIGQPSSIFHYHPHVHSITNWPSIPEMDREETLERALDRALHAHFQAGPSVGAIMTPEQEEIVQVQDAAVTTIRSVMSAARRNGAHRVFSWLDEGHIHLHRAVRHLLVALLARYPKSARLARALANVTKAAEELGCPDANIAKPCSPREDHVAAGLCRAAMDVATPRTQEKT
jgi:hypothetical protein